MKASRLFAAIMNGQSRAIGNIGYTRQEEDKQTKKTKKQKRNTANKDDQQHGPKPG